MVAFKTNLILFGGFHDDGTGDAKFVLSSSTLLSCCLRPSQQIDCLSCKQSNYAYYLPDYELLISATAICCHLLHMDTRDE